MCALSTTYQKGYTLYHYGHVKPFEAETCKEQEIQFSMEVKGDSYRTYQTTVKLEKNQADREMSVKEYFCSCEAFRNYSGICKHLVAAMFEINNKFSIEDAEELLTAQARGRKTSPELQALISTAVLKERNEFCQEVSGGNVKLEITLYLTSDSEQIELRIGRTQMYVVKNISEMISNIRNQQYVVYGKNLSFVHNLAAFSEESKPLVSALLNVQLPKKQAYAYSRGRSYFSSPSSEKRYLDVDAYLMDELFHIYEGKMLSVQDCITGKKCQTAILKENPRLPLKIKHRADEKHVKILFPQIIIMEGARQVYIWWQQAIYICSEDFNREMKEVLPLMRVNKSRKDRGNYYYSSDVNKSFEMTLNEADYAVFSAAVLPVLEKYMEVTVKGIDFSEYQMEEGNFQLYFDMDGENVICQAKAIYGEHTHNLLTIATAEQAYRDIRSEYEIRTLLSEYLPERTEDGKCFLLRADNDRLAALVEEGILQLKVLAEVFVSDSFKKIRIANQVKISAGLSLKGNLLNITWDVSGMSREELYEILSSYQRKKKYYRLKNGELLNLYDSGISVFADMQEDLHLSKAQWKEGEANVPVYRSMYMDSLMKENESRIKVSRDEMFEQMMEKFEQVKEKIYPVSKEVQAKLRKYQKEGYQWISSLAELGFGGILADDMGLGKTLQMITYFCAEKGTPHLVVCPASLVYNWEAELHRFAPSLKVCLMTGTASERSGLLAHYREYNVVVTSYDLLRRDIENYQDKEFMCQVIDEAQFIKNPGTQAAKAVRAIHSRVRFALTGTPIENRLSELWSIFEYLMPGYLYSYKHFKERFETKIMQEEGDEQIARLHKMIQPFFMRRLKKDVLKDLPDKVEKVVYSKFEKEQEKLYRATEKQLLMNLKENSGEEFRENKLQILAEITRLRQICCDPALVYEDYTKGSAKLEACLEVIGSALEGGHKILLFSQFASMLKILEKRLLEQNIRVLLMTGSTTKQGRRKMVEQFQNHQADIFLISLKAGGTGLNLTAADMVIHYDPWWNMAAQNQATDRAHRIGQENKVTVVKMIARNTIEERILKLQEKKQDLADKIISGEGGSLGTLTKEELMDLFQEG